MVATPVSYQITWEKLPDDYVLPDDPVDNIQQPALAFALTESLARAGRLWAQTLATTNYGICATVNGKIVVKAPDWCYVAHISVPVEDVLRSYTPQLQGERPTVVMEFLSDNDGHEYSNKPTYPPGKWFFYEQILQVPYYVIFNPYSGQIEVYRLESERYTLQTANSEGRYWIEPMGLFIGVWQGTRENFNAYWLRWWDERGELLLWGAEQIEQERERAQQERERAERLAARLRALGVDLEED
ncbi:Uma2 family endonuclease [Spirulina subsalsa]|uniref:Uma2 family endonuclease n=1 Tax=Spirulina subsalsa TaxID=54311 RepID=UPI0002D53470|nr:Uma2 family endonuclease [Spirulina subsalsa]